MKLAASPDRQQTKQRPVCNLEAPNERLQLLVHHAIS